jgi:expansin (peptidoglycan-binding protein)
LSVGEIFTCPVSLDLKHQCAQLTMWFLDFTAQGEHKEVIVTVADVCEECGPTDLDLSFAAFKTLADPRVGEIPIAWHTT